MEDNCMDRQMDRPHDGWTIGRTDCGRTGSNWIKQGQLRSQKNQSQFGSLKMPNLGQSGSLYPIP
jgi:hypothetical protein